jgi:hypothetical protein
MDFKNIIWLNKIKILFKKKILKRQYIKLTHKIHGLCLETVIN